MSEDREMSEIGRAFGSCRQQRRSAFIPFLMAGDPDLQTTGDLLHALVAAGADLIEVGIPFSDPIADGPVNQRAAYRALQSGTTLSGILSLVARHREKLGIPIVLFSYFNPIHARGIRTFAEQAASSGVDGVLCVDLPPDEAAEDLIPELDAHGLDHVFLVAPTSTPTRIDRISRCSSGFVYYVSRTGVTGEQGELPEELIRQVRKVRRRITQPLAVGFGISTPEQVAEIARVADGVVVGSALVRVVEEHCREHGDAVELSSLLEARASDLSAPLHRRRSRFLGRR